MPHAVQQAVLSIAGSDPSGGAGVQADIKTISALGGYAMAALTALTAQNTQGVRSLHVPDPAFVREQLDAVSDDVRIDAVKIGMLGTAGVAEQVAAWLGEVRPPHVVLDPVMVSRSGHRLLDADAVRTIRDELCPVVDLVAPNLLELADLLEVAQAVSWSDALAQGRALAGATGTRVLVKGGHLGGPCSPDALVEPDGQVHELPGDRVLTRSTHGTGCTLSAALATLRPVRADWLTAARDAKGWLAAAIAAGDQLRIGSGHGPVHHFHAYGGAGANGKPSFTDQVWSQTAQVRAAIDELPFVRGLADGTLPDAAFREYLRQDALYLEQYARALATLAAMAPTTDEQLFWSGSSQECLQVERALHESWVDVPHSDGADGADDAHDGASASERWVEPPSASAACTAYTSYLLAVAHRGEYAELVAAVLPCFWVYADVGERLQVATSGRTEHPYRQWIDQYGDPEFAVRTQWVRDLADRLAEQGGPDRRLKMSQAFATATRYEWMFWDSPWRGEHWPV